MTLVSLALLGGFDCRAGEGSAIRFPTLRTRALMAYLARKAGASATRDKLAELFWDGPPASARVNLRKTLSRLRCALPEPAQGIVLADAERIAVELGPLEVDVVRFERLAADGTPETLERAAALYHGPFLEGFGDCGEPFEAWLTNERRRLEELYQDVLARLLAHHTACGSIERAIAIALDLLDVDPLQEEAQRTLIRLYLSQDRIGAAADQYERYRALLAAELGARPAAATEELAAAIRRMTPGRATGHTPAAETDAVPAARPTNGPVRATGGGRSPSIVVLPLAQTGEGSRDEPHFGDGLAEDLATELGRFRGLDVIAPVTAMAYRRARVPPDRAAAELGADYALAGSVRLAGARIRITARLVDAATGRQVWADRHDCDAPDCLEIQDDIARQLVGLLVPRLESARLEASRRRRPEDWDTYELWLRGVSALRRADLGGIHDARSSFRRAVERDPTFARGYVGLAMAHLSEWACHSWNHWVFLRDEAVELAGRAVELDPFDHLAHCMLGMARLYARDYGAAEQHMTRALELNPSDTDVLAHASLAYALLGDHTRGVGCARRALRLAPHRPEWYVGFAGIALFAARRHEEAIDALAAAPQAICDTPAFIAASYAHIERVDACEVYRDTLYRHYRHQRARGAFASAATCIDWLHALNPFRERDDIDHFERGLRKAGIE